MIYKAIHRAYQILKERNWDTVYWAIDLHGVCLESNYENGGYKFVNQQAIDTLKYISSLPESRIILWSSAHAHEQGAIMNFFSRNGIDVDYFNENPEVANTKTGAFNQKFYFSILLDDKAGFDPIVDWATVYYWTRACSIEWNNGLQLDKDKI